MFLIKLLLNNIFYKQTFKIISILLFLFFILIYIYFDLDIVILRNIINVCFELYESIVHTELYCEEVIEAAHCDCDCHKAGCVQAQYITNDEQWAYAVIIRKDEFKMLCFFVCFTVLPFLIQVTILDSKK